MILFFSGTPGLFLQSKMSPWWVFSLKQKNTLNCSIMEIKKSARVLISTSLWNLSNYTPLPVVLIENQIHDVWAYLNSIEVIVKLFQFYTSFQTSVILTSPVFRPRRSLTIVLCKNSLLRVVLEPDNSRDSHLKICGIFMKPMSSWNLKVLQTDHHFGTHFSHLTTTTIFYLSMQFLAMILTTKDKS